MVADDVRRYPGATGVRVALAPSAADAVGLAVLVRASSAARTLVL
jgi:hypothetical protein